MGSQKVNVVILDKAITAIGKIFEGDYSKSEEYLDEIKTTLNEGNFPFITNKVMGVYYDNPEQEKEENLKSFQGFFVADEHYTLAPLLTKISLKCKYLYTSISSEPIKSVYKGYVALFDHVKLNNVTLKSPTSYQVRTLNDGIVTSEIYMELDD